MLKTYESRRNLRSKDERASSAWASNGAVVEAIRRIRSEVPEILVITDVCLCGYTTDGACGIRRDDGRFDLPVSRRGLARMARAHADAGAHLVAPSARLDGMVSEIRRELDDGHESVGILSYAAKFASAFYGPFREAALSGPAAGGRESHQLDPANRREAMAQIGRDIEEGADLVMVKPGLPYLDVIHQAHQAFPSVPIVAYQVSGEYAQLRAAGERGWLDADAAMLESLLALRRAGADLVITYDALSVAGLVAGRSLES